MHLKSLHIQNFRRLVDVIIDFEERTTVFVGANNSGKTSVAHILRCFLDTGHSFTFHDFSASCWETFDLADHVEAAEVDLPKITLDVWFQVSESDLHKVIGILPSLDWEDQPLGIRFEFGPRDTASLIDHYTTLRKGNRRQTRSDSDMTPWPVSLSDYLRKEVRREYVIRHYVIEADAAVEGKLPATYEPLPLGDYTESAAKIIRSLIRVDFLDAQRFLSDSDSRGRSQDLSRRLSSFYKRNLEQLDLNPESRHALAQSEQSFNAHLEKVFRSTLERLSNLGYPGFAEPKLLIPSSLNSEQVVSQNASVHYELSPPNNSKSTASRSRTLPDRYSGLGFKNLIYMVVELLDFREQCGAQTPDRPALHLILIEEPEVHLHVQLQQVFVKKIFDVVASDAAGVPLQMIITTHSPHIIDENDYEIVRYFRRRDPNTSLQNSTSVLNLADLNEKSGDQEFLRRYLKLTHCDLFFADGAILVEGNVERLLLPLMISKSAPVLASRYLTILEVGGNFAYKFAPLVDLLGIPMLIVTDLDSVDPVDNRKTCMADQPGALSSNSTLKRWLTSSIAALLELSEAEKAVSASEGGEVALRLAYQTRSVAEIGCKKISCTGRTFEETFTFENFTWVEANDSISSPLGVNQDLGPSAPAEDYLRIVHERVRKDFKKTDFALGLLTSDQGWSTPNYIAEGLKWLESSLARLTTTPAPDISEVVQDVHQ